MRTLEEIENQRKGDSELRVNWEKEELLNENQKAFFFFREEIRKTEERDLRQKANLHRIKILSNQISKKEIELNSLREELKTLVYDGKTEERAFRYYGSREDFERKENLDFRELIYGKRRD